MFGRKKIYVCQGRSCRAFGSSRILDLLKSKLGYRIPDKKFKVDSCKCTSFCQRAVSVRIGDKIIHDVTEDNVFDKIEDEKEHHNIDPGQRIVIDDDFLGDI